MARKQSTRKTVFHKFAPEFSVTRNDDLLSSERRLATIAGQQSKEYWRARGEALTEAERIKSAIFTDYADREVRLIFAAELAFQLSRLIRGWKYESDERGEVKIVSSDTTNWGE